MALEEMWGYALPKSYRNFLLEGSKIGDKKSFAFKDKFDGSCLSDFLRIEKDFNNNILLKQKYAGTRFPNNFLPIARDVYGNFILLSVKNKDRGKIYFWDHEMEADEGETPDYSNLTLIADSFDEFIEGLHSDDEVSDDV